MPRAYNPQSYYREKFREFIDAVESGMAVPKACKLYGLGHRNATHILNRAGYRLKWVKINDDGSEDHLDAWE